MKIAILSDDIFLINGIKNINRGVKYAFMKNVESYMNNFSDKKKIVLVDDRIKNINILKLKNRTRDNDILIRVCFNKEKDFNFIENSITVKKTLNDFNTTLIKMINLVERNTLISKSKGKYLTPREAQVLSLYLNGRDTKWICNYLSLNEKTISNYKSKITKKYGCSNFLNFCRIFISV